MLVLLDVCQVALSKILMVAVSEIDFVPLPGFALPVIHQDLVNPPGSPADHDIRHSFVGGQSLRVFIRFETDPLRKLHYRIPEVPLVENESPRIFDDHIVRSNPALPLLVIFRILLQRLPFRQHCLRP